MGEPTAEKTTYRLPALSKKRHRRRWVNAGHRSSEARHVPNTSTPSPADQNQNRGCSSFHGKEGFAKKKGLACQADEIVLGDDDVIDFFRFGR